MRLELLYNPRLLVERLAIESQRQRRLGKLRVTVAASLKSGHIDSLELLELAKPQQPQVIYDIGANIGTWSLLAKAVFPQATIHAFEPLVMHHEPFEKAVKNVSDITMHKVALGSKPGTLNMQVASFSDASSLLEIAEATQEYFGVTKEREEAVKVVTLDEYATITHLPLPDLIKLDIQGYELEALRGASNCCRHANLIITEISFLEFYKGQALFHEVVEFLQDRGFYLYALGVNTPLGQRLSQTDALFARENC